MFLLTSHDTIITHDYCVSTKKTTPPLVIPVALPEVAAFTPSHLSLATPYDLDETVRFHEENHTYFVRYPDMEHHSSTGVISVSSLWKGYFADFNAEEIITNMMASSNWKNSVYFGMSRIEIIDLWETNRAASSLAGKRYHLAVECFLNGWAGIHQPPYSTSIAIQQFLMYWDKVVKANFIPFRTELKYRSSKPYLLCGTADLLLVRKDHPVPEECGGVLSLHLRDHKNSKKINFSSYGKKTGHGCCSHLEDCNFIHYALQQNIYKYMHEKWYQKCTWQGREYSHVKIESMQLLVAHENYPELQVIEIPIMTETVEEMFEDRKKSLQ
jgi:hypothetical protein